MRTVGDHKHRPWRPLPDAGADGDAIEVPELINVMLGAVPAIFGGNDFVEAVVAGVTTSGGLYVYVNDVMGLAYIGWLLIVGISMMRVKPKAVAPMLLEREMKEAG